MSEICKEGFKGHKAQELVTLKTTSPPAINTRQNKKEFTSATKTYSTTASKYQEQYTNIFTVNCGLC